VPGLGALQLAKLDPQQVQHFLNTLSAAGLSATTVKHCRDCLRAALNVAMGWNLLVRNPAAVVKLPRRIRSKPQVFLCTIQNLRHSAATLLHAAGVPSPAIKKSLGHAGVRTTEEVYMHCSTDMDPEAAEWKKGMVRPARLERATFWFVARRSIQLSYGREKEF
jgi:integrase